MIHILSESLRNQIAAGEVVERPASVVKELVENALDAGAKNIFIDLEEAGLKKIEVRDDGEGMSREDAILAVKRHATSKIHSKEDLFDIHTLGFRGEALASIASVSLFTLQTQQSKALSGTCVEIHAGHELEPRACSCSQGTSIAVESLFDNIPARKKFLKTESTELKHSIETVEDLAFCQPQVAFQLKHNGKELVKVFDESFDDRVRHLLPEDIFEKLLPLNFQTPTIAVTGFVSRPGEIFKTRNNQKIFINKRSVKNSTVLAAVNDAFHSFLERGAFPAFYIFIDISPDLVDVNVHPRKSEVNFLRGQEVFAAVCTAILQAFEQKHREFQGIVETQIFASLPPVHQHPSVYPKSSFSSASHLPRGIASSHNDMNALSYNNAIIRDNAPRNDRHENTKQTLDFGFHQTVDQADELGGYRIVGQAARKFLILEKGDRIIFLDQHAVHERARYDEFMRAYREKMPQSQRLLLPEIIHCSQKEAIHITERLDFFQKIGFEIEEFGNASFQILALPQQVPNENLKEVILKVCEELGEKGSSRETESHIEKALTYLSCRGAIMFGDDLSYEEMKAIVKNWLRFAKGLTCPHGRPLGFEITVQEMEKKVGR